MTPPTCRQNNTFFIRIQSIYCRLKFLLVTLIALICNFNERLQKPILLNMREICNKKLDAIPIGAGFAGLYQLFSLSENPNLHVTEVVNKTLLPRANHSRYLGANIPGKPRVFMQYANGLNNYRNYCDEVASIAYKGFMLSK